MCFLACELNFRLRDEELAMMHGDREVEEPGYLSGRSDNNGGGRRAAGKRVLILFFFFFPFSCVCCLGLFSWFVV